MESPAPRLRLFDLTCLGLNSVIGSGVFLTPGAIAALLFGWSVPAFLVGAVLCYAIALCFAEMAALMPVTGGAYTYARQTFGDFVGFLVGWVIWLSGILGWAAVAVGLADAMPGPGAAWIVGAVVILSALNARGAREGAGSNNLLAMAKLLPLGVFVLWSLPRLHVTLARLPDGNHNVLAGVLLILYTYSGFEDIPVPATDVIEPQRTIPRALGLVLLISAVLYMLIQAGACSLGVHDQLREAAQGVPWLMWLIGIGAAISLASVNASIAFTSPRSLWALARDGFLPEPLARLHPRFGTPWNAILVNATATLLMVVLSNQFAVLATLSVLASLLQYIPTALAVIVWQRRAKERVFRAPWLAPWVALAVCGVLLKTTDLPYLLGAGIALAIGMLVYPLTRFQR
ncbi:MAG: APC family permease [Candidatus Xenobia bacterium]